MVLDSIARARAELLRLRALEQDVCWGKIEMEPDKAERLRQYLAGRSEISAGDQLVLRHLHGKGRERQRLALGLPLLIIGFGGIYAVGEEGGMALHRSALSTMVREHERAERR